MRTPADLYYSAEIAGPETTVVYTRVAPPGHPRPPGHLVLGDLPAVVPGSTVAYVCGSSAFADHATDLVVQTGVPVGSVRVERFGPTG